VLAWHHDHLFSQSHAHPKHYHHRERECWLACAAGLLGQEFDTRAALVFEQLDSMVRASSLVAMVNGLIRPSLKSCKGQLTQEALHLMMFSPNHPRYKSGKRQGKAPIELLTGTPLEAPWWELLLHQVHSNQDAKATDASPPQPPLQWKVNNDRRADQRALAPCRARVEHAGASEQEHRRTVPHAASSFPLGWQRGRLKRVTQTLRLCLHPAIPEV
jgi:hypothetical protein